MMKQRRFLVYLLGSGLLVLGALSVYVYQEYLGEDPVPALENGQNPIIDQKVNGIVTHTSVNTIGHQHKLDVTYTNTESNEAVHFTVNADYAQRIHSGDTVMKDKGEKILLINRKDGKAEIVPID